MTPQNRYYADFSDPAKIRIITILGRPPDITCTPKHARYVGGIVITLQQFTKESAQQQNEKYIYKNDSNESRNNWYNTKIQITAETERCPTTDKIQIGLRVLKITMASISLPRPSRRDTQANVVRLQTCWLHIKVQPKDGSGTTAWQAMLKRYQHKDYQK